MAEIAVSCKNVTKTYHSGAGPVQALRGIDLEIETGSLYMIVGPSGSGKTTLISIIAAILDYDEGACTIFDQNVKDMDPTFKIQYRGQNIGFVFQSFNLLPTLTASENVAIPLILNGMPRNEAIKNACEVLDKVGLGSYHNTRPSHLSGGQQQRVAIARSIVHKPKIIICDEPTSSLDHETGTKVIQLMRELVVKEDRTLIIVTHDNRIYSFADKIAFISDGTVEKIVDAKSALGTML